MKNFKNVTKEQVRADFAQKLREADVLEAALRKQQFTVSNGEVNVTFRADGTICSVTTGNQTDCILLKVLETGQRQALEMREAAVRQLVPNEVINYVNDQSKQSQC